MTEIEDNANSRDRGAYTRNIYHENMGIYVFLQFCQAKHLRCFLAFKRFKKTVARARITRETKPLNEYWNFLLNQAKQLGFVGDWIGK